MVFHGAQGHTHGVPWKSYGVRWKALGVPWKTQGTPWSIFVRVCHITLCLCFCNSSVNWCTYVVLITTFFDILILFMLVHMSVFLMQCSCQLKFHVHDNKVLTYLLTYLGLAADTVKHAIVLHSCSIIQAPAPDHKAAVLDLITQVNTRGKGYWKMNVSVLDDNEYVQLMTNVITSTINEYEHSVSKGALWEYLNRLIKEHTIKFCTMKARAWHD